MFTAGSNIKGVYWLTFAAFLAVYIFLIAAFIGLSKELKKDGADKKIKVGSAVDNYNLARSFLWAMQGCYFAIFSLYFIKNSGSDGDFVYQSKRRSALGGYIVWNILATVFCVFQIFLVPIVSVVSNS